MKGGQGRNSSVGTSRFCATKTLSPGIALALSLYFSRQVFALCLPLHGCSVLLCVSVLEKENYFPSYERSEEDGNVFSF